MLLPRRPDGRLAVRPLSLLPKVGKRGKWTTPLGIWLSEMYDGHWTGSSCIDLEKGVRKWVGGNGSSPCLQ